MMSPSQEARKRGMEATLKKVAGVPVELTIRGKKSFTFSFEGTSPEPAERLEDWLLGYLNPIRVDVSPSEETDMTCVYLELT